MPYLQFETAKNLNEWRDPDRNKAIGWKFLSKSWKYCSYGSLLHDAFFPPLTLDEYCCQSLSADALNRRNCDQATVNPLGEASHTLGEIPNDKTLITVHQAWIWRIEDNVILSARYPARDSRPGDFESTDMLRYIACVLGNFCWPSCPLPTAKLTDLEPELFLRFQKAIVEVSEVAESYLWDISAYGLESGVEKTCLHRIIDIGDELSMVKRVTTEQQRVWKTFAKKSWPGYWNNSLGFIVMSDNDRACLDKRARDEWELILEMDTSFEDRITRTRQMEEEAQRVERTVMLMIELKSKHTAIRESRASMGMNIAVTSFAVVTVIFTPMTYIATLFALPIKQLQKMQSKSVFGDSGAYASGFVAWISGECLPIWFPFSSFSST